MNGDDDLAGLFELQGLPAPAPKADAVPSGARRGMTAREVRTLFAAHSLPAPGRGVIAETMKASAMVAAAPAASRMARPKPAKPAHRPIDGHSRTWDAACLYRELRRAGLRNREATDALRIMLGTSRAGIMKYRHHPVEPVSGVLIKTRGERFEYECEGGPHADEKHPPIERPVDAGRNGAKYVVAKRWGMIRLAWFKLTPKARDALQPLVAGGLLVRDPPR